MFVSYQQPQNTENIVYIAQLINHSLCYIFILKSYGIFPLKNPHTSQ